MNFVIKEMSERMKKKFFIKYRYTPVYLRVFYLKHASKLTKNLFT